MFWMLLIAIVIIWLNIGIRATREMNDIDNDAAEWTTFPKSLKILTIILAPILLILFERGVLETKSKKS